jgi:hypothetical protein
MTIYHLYVKTHNITGLKYLGQTKRTDPDIYPGTGKRWSRHLKKHGKDVSTIILLSTNNKLKLREVGLYYSELWNIVESNEWANLRPEDGGIIDSNTFLKMSQSQKGRKLSEKHRARLVEVNTGKHHTEETKEKLRIVRKQQKPHVYTEEQRNKIGAALRGKPKSVEHKAKLTTAVTCPHCGKVGAQNAMKRWHFNNCKSLCPFI